MPYYLYIPLVILVAILLYRSGYLIERSHIEVVRELKHSNGVGKFLALVVRFREGTARPLRNQSILEGWLKENLYAFAPLTAQEGDRTAPDIITIAQSGDPSLPKDVSFQTQEEVNGQIRRYRVEFIGSSPFLIKTEINSFEFGEYDQFIVVSHEVTSLRQRSFKALAKATFG